MTCLSVSRTLVTEPKDPDLTPIISAPTINPDVESEIKKLIPIVMKENHLAISRPVWKDFHLTTKRGPNGIALLSSFMDAHYLTEGLMESLRIVGGQSLLDTVNRVRTYDLPKIITRFKIKDHKPLLRKLSIVRDPEAKDRIIAILDYWSQTS